MLNMKKFTLIYLFTCLVFILTNNNLTAQNQSDTTKSVLERGLDQVKLQKARHYFMNYQYRLALEAYEDILQTNKENALVIFRIGEVNYYLKNYANAVKMIGNALEKTPMVTPNAPFVYAQALHRNGNIEKAIEQYEVYKASLKENKTKEIEEVNKLIANLKIAQELIANPVNVEIKNMGTDINSAFDDYGPSVSADGKTIIFTSRRPDTKGGETDDLGDGKYFEDIYISYYDETLGKWTKSEGIEGKLNTEGHDACLSISPDGQYIYIYKNLGEKGSGEIYESKLSNSGKWGAPKSLGKPINTSFWESSASVTLDGQKMYFVSERKGGLGMGDIWVSEKISKNQWGEPKNLGGIINTPDDEKMVFIHPEGDILFFASDGHPSIGGYDIYMSEMIDGQWSKPINLGYPINTVDDDVNFSLSLDGYTAYYSGFKTNSLGGKDIYQIDLTNHELIKKVRDMYIVVNATVTDDAGNPLKGNAKVELLNEDRVVVKEFKLNPEENFTTKLRKNQKLTIVVKSGGYKPTEIPFFVDDADKKEDTIEIKLGK
jgi:tetratricopeptide (TPR) repeat protein